MTVIRQIHRIVTGKRTVDGAGVQLVRVLGYRDTKDFDPFLMLDTFDSSDPEDYIKGFPWHPHRGIETITYLIQGDIEHGDSLGNSGSILDGDCQWMTAGSGIIHQEMPKASSRMFGAQLWLNLPARDKMAPPAYGDIRNETMPVISGDGFTVRIVAGKYQGLDGAFQGRFVKATYLDVELEPGQEWTYASEPGQTLFIYLFSGSAVFDPDKNASDPAQLTREKQAVLFTDGDTFWTKAGPEGIRFILLCAPPLREPIAWGGPIVMNTEAELEQAFKELEKGTFIKNP